ncbi:MAG: ATP-binding protein [Dysosmobacter sp.]
MKTPSSTAKPPPPSISGRKKRRTASPPSPFGTTVKVSPGPPSPLIRLFYPPRLSPTGDGKRNMGLGLSVCSAVVKAHGGCLTAHNHPDGAEFIFCLPMPPADPAISTDLSEEETL